MSWWSWESFLWTLGILAAIEYGAWRQRRKDRRNRG